MSATRDTVQRCDDERHAIEGLAAPSGLPDFRSVHVESQ